MRPACTRCCAGSATSNASSPASRCAARGRATSRNCALRSTACRSCRRCSPTIDSPRLAELARAAGEHPAARELLHAALVESPPALLREGGAIATGHDAELDELRRIAEHSDEALLELETRERERTGLANLKLGYNRVQGYYIEVYRSQAEQVPAHWVRRQTVKNAERYITPELKQFEDRVLGARDRSLARERVLYEALLDRLVAGLPALQASAAALAELDVLAALAERARSLRLARPELERRIGHRDSWWPPPGRRAAPRRPVRAQ